MTTRWVVRQRVQAVQKAWLVDVFESQYERISRQTYDTFVSDNPDAYFELVCVEHNETCHEWTKPK